MPPPTKRTSDPGKRANEVHAERKKAPTLRALTFQRTRRFAGAHKGCAWRQYRDKGLFGVVATIHPRGHAAILGEDRPARLHPPSLRTSTLRSIHHPHRQPAATHQQGTPTLCRTAAPCRTVLCRTVLCRTVLCRAASRGTASLNLRRRTQLCSLPRPIPTRLTAAGQDHHGRHRA